MISKKVALSLLLYTLSVSFIIAEQNVAPQPKPNQTCIKKCLDSLFYNHFGLAGINPSHENFIRNVIKEMGMENYHIELRAMNYYAIMLFGYKNAVTFGGLFSQSNLNIIYINQAWFDTLSHEEKRALIGHELIHIRNRHFPKKIMARCVSLILSGGLAFKVVRSIEPNAFDPKAQNTWRKTIAETLTYKLFLLLVYLSQIPNNWYSRLCEKEADMQSAKLLQCAEGAAQLWSQFVDKTEKQHPLLKKWLSKIHNKKIRKIIKSVLFSHTHPQPKERVAYMKNLALESQSTQNM